MVQCQKEENEYIEYIPCYYFCVHAVHDTFT